ncbi:hypothetical protein T11_13734, partial [Trichinella zimbabwensis]
MKIVRLIQQWLDKSWRFCISKLGLEMQNKHKGIT